MVLGSVCISGLCAAHVSAGDLLPFCSDSVDVQHTITVFKRLSAGQAAALMAWPPHRMTG
jgi:hypothetical protein